MGVGMTGTRSGGATGRRYVQRCVTFGEIKKIHLIFRYRQSSWYTCHHEWMQRRKYQDTSMRHIRTRQPENRALSSVNLGLRRLNEHQARCETRATCLHITHGYTHVWSVQLNWDGEVLWSAGVLYQTVL